MNLSPGDIPIAAYNYDLPQERIAQYPLERRDDSKLLIHRDHNTWEDRFANLPDLLPGNSTLVFNETRVIHARLIFLKPGGSRIEIFCLEPLGKLRDYQVAFQQKGCSEWLCLVGNSKKWKEGILTTEQFYEGRKIILVAERLERSSNYSAVRFSWTPAEISFSEILEVFGEVPLPPYISRQATARDAGQYQTVYARQDGSVAAPTAGLHFTPDLLKSLERKGHRPVNFLLHVGAGTFRPVQTELIGDHRMHQEFIRYDLENLKQLYRSLDDPVVLVGTTSVRLMESLYWHGVKLILGLTEGSEIRISQWEPYQIGDRKEINRKLALERVIESIVNSGKNSLTGSTRLMIAPGYRFRYPEILITNFHQPKSTLLLLIAAFIGDDWKKAYQFALDHDFRFLSYGDSCLFYRQATNR